MVGGRGGREWASRGGTIGGADGYVCQGELRTSVSMLEGGLAALARQR